MRRQCREDVRIYDANDPLTLEVIQNLYATPNKKKEIANRFNIPLDVVHKIYKVHCRGQEKFLDQYNEQKVVMDDNVVEPEEIAESAVEEEPVVEKKHRGRGHGLNEETILSIVSDVESGMMATHVARKYNVSWTTVDKYCKQFGVVAVKGKPGKKPNTITITDSTKTVEDEKRDVVKAEVPTPVVKDDAAEINISSATSVKKVKFLKTIRVGLINDRHDMPVDKYIFDDVPNNRLFDYDWYDKVAYDWLSNNVSFGDALIVFCTGLTAAVTSVQKQCEKLNIPLTFAHFNIETRGYCYQKITGDDVVIGEDDIELVSDINFSRVYSNLDYVTLVDCTIDSINQKKKFYSICCQDMAADKISMIATSFVDNFESIWKVYPKYIQKSLMTMNKKLAVFINENLIHDDGYIEMGRAISKHYNFK